MRGVFTVALTLFLFLPGPYMAGPADDLKDKVRDLAHTDPMMRIGDMMGAFGQKVRDTYDKVKAKASEMVDSAETYMKGADDAPTGPKDIPLTPQGTAKGTASKAARKRIKQIKVNPSANGGFTVTHHYHPEYGGTPKPDTHVFTDYDDLEQHIQSTAGGQ